MVQFLADENLNNQIVRGMLRQSSDIDIVRVQDVGLSGADDPTVLAWAAQEGRIVLTHDVATMTTLFCLNTPYRVVIWKTSVY
jgi:predicted nuclease of predicted toxin-antitoxin system